MPCTPPDIIAALPLDRALATPLFRQLYAAMKAAILDGTPGARHAAAADARALRRLLPRVSRQTVLNAYALLTAEGYLDGAVGKGTFVSRAVPRRRWRRQRQPGLLRPLSARGQGVVTAMAQVAFHRGPLRAFRVGMPRIDLFPFDVWNRLEARRWRRPDHRFGYGDPAGFLPLRELLCVYLQAARGGALHAAADRHHLGFAAGAVPAVDHFAGARRRGLDGVARLPGRQRHPAAPAARGCSRCRSMPKGWMWPMARRTARKRSWPM